MIRLNTKQLKAVLANRYPYLLIDIATEVEPGISSKGYKNLTANEWYFPVHFPEEPMMPGMVQMEALLQTLSLTVLTLEGNAGKIIRGKSAAKIKLKRRVMPGSRLYMEAELLSYDGNMAHGKAKGFIGGEEACSGEFMFTIHENDEFAEE